MMYNYAGAWPTFRSCLRRSAAQIDSGEEGSKRGEDTSRLESGTLPPYGR